MNTTILQSKTIGIVQPKTKRIAATREAAVREKAEPKQAPESNGFLKEIAAAVAGTLTAMTSMYEPVPGHTRTQRVRVRN
jgi:hypothetical protein